MARRDPHFSHVPAKELHARLPSGLYSEDSVSLSLRLRRVQQQPVLSPLRRTPESAPESSQNDLMCKMVYDHFSVVYTSGNPETCVLRPFLESLNTRFPLEMAADLELPFARAEVEAAIKTCNRRKVPGPDGLPVEVYLTFWPEVGHYFTAMLNEISTTGELARTRIKRE
ncbi:hypothetical protein V1525DRAFT_440364 [Lipomyces kononenkoae]|uniref:Uncharacterized protein n=1 Tax=Lipomyces kononenkoae TaxID=34357 RepID=A0ACC3T691_LIPKO